MMRVQAVLIGGALALAAGALPAIAQQAPNPQPGAPQSGTIVQQGDVNEQFPDGGKPDQVDQIDRVVSGGPQRMGFRAPEGVKLVAPGALLFASFDRNFDGKVTREEIDASAPGAFAAADRNKDGKVTGFEQSDWAASVGSPNDILANAMTFDTDMDRSVTPAEFASGLKRIADQVMGAGNTEINFAELVKPLNQSDRQAERGPQLIDPRAGGRTLPNGVNR
jgi:EF hand